MLIRFGLSNFKSIYDYQELSMVATKLSDHDDHKIADPAIKEALLPVAGIYGPNASGKTNVLEGLQFFTQFIRRSNIIEAGEKIRRNPFKLSAEKKLEPSEFAADFILDGEHFQYGFAINDTAVLKEWLFSYKISYSGRKTRSVLFDRDAAEENKFYFGKNLKGRNKTIEDLTKDNSLYLSTAAQNNHDQLSAVFQYFRTQFDFRVLDIEDRSSDFEIKDLLRKDSIRTKVEALLSSTDTGIKSIKIKDIELSKEQVELFEKLGTVLFSEASDEKSEFAKRGALEKMSREITLFHEGADGELTEFELKEESLGTQSLLSILCPALEALEDGGVFIIDELDSSLHTLLAQMIISIFTTREVNTKNAQLIFSTHDTNILSSGIMRRDEIWITEKNRKGETILYPLSDLKVRKTDDLETGYLQGRFGGIPFFSSIENIISILENRDAR